MRFVHGVFTVLLAATCMAAEPVELPAERIKSLVVAVTEASNRMMKSGSTVADVDALFSLYSDDFVYIHQAYGGEYSRELLYRNSVKNLNAGRYNNTQDRYRIVNILTGLNAAAIERVEVKSGKCISRSSSSRETQSPKSLSTGSRFPPFGSGSVVRRTGVVSWMKRG